MPGRISCPKSLTSSSVTEADFGVAFAKESLYSTLAKEKGDTSTVAVQEAVGILEQMNPNRDDPLRADLFEGTFVSDGFSTDGASLVKGGWKCTMGRLSFNFFEPREQEVIITGVVNDVGKPMTAKEIEAVISGTSLSKTIAKLPDDTPIRRYFLTSSFKTVGATEVKGTIAAQGICWPAVASKGKEPVSPGTITVAFPSIEMKPASGQNEAAFDSVFNLSKRKQKLSLRTKIKRKFESLVVKLILGSKKDASAKYKINLQRPPTAPSEIFYVDDDLKLQRGKRQGTLSILRRNGIGFSELC